MARFTVAIPTHDRCETVVLAARSVLDQTRPPEQLIITCDGCTDGSADALRAIGDPRLEVVELPKGRGYAYGHRNVALERASGDVITWLGDDDLLLPDHLERLEERWDRGDVDLVTTPAVIVSPEDELTWIGRDWSVPYFREWLQRENTNVMASVSARVALLRSIGGWDDAVPRAGDWDLWRRAVESGKRVAMLDEPTVLHFRATGRRQAWPDRVRQNEKWAARTRNAEALPELRRRMRHARGAAEAASLRDRMDEIESLRAHARTLEAHGEHARTYARSLEADREQRTRAEAQLRRRIDELERAGASEREQRERAEAERAHALERAERAEAEVARQRTVLDETFSGGWWRLRNRLRRAASPLLFLRRWLRG